MNKYESVIIINPNVDEEGIKALVQKFTDLINTDGKVEKVDDLGKRKLAYEVKKQKEGYYQVFNFEANPELIKELERNYRITDEVINEIKNNPKVAKYFDIPIQHASNKILKAMNRRGSKEFIVDLIAKIRKQIPDVTIRTTLIVGFPTENNQDFKELVDFVEEIKFNRLGVFTYSDEEDTKGYLMEPKVSETTMKKRLNAIMQIQNGISNKLNHEYIGKTYSAIIDSYDSQANKYIVRNEAYAPDDVDGFIYATNDSGLKVNIGDIVKIKITDANSYDLFAKIIKD